MPAAEADTESMQCVLSRACTIFKGVSSGNGGKDCDRLIWLQKLQSCRKISMPNGFPRGSLVSESMNSEEEPGENAVVAFEEGMSPLEKLPCFDMIGL